MAKGKKGTVVTKGQKDIRSYLKGQKDIRSYLLPKMPQTSFLVPKNPPKKTATCVKKKEELSVSMSVSQQVLKPIPQSVQAQLLMRLPLVRLEMHYKYLSKPDSW